MCGRTALLLDEDEVEEFAFPYSRGRWQGRELYRPSYNVCPGRYQPVIALCRDGSTTKHLSRSLYSMKWGLVPHWTKGPVDYGTLLKTINARGETISTKPTFRPLVDGKRCTVLCNGFIEWAHEGKLKIPYYVQHEDGRPMALGGLYSVRKVEDGKTEYTYTIITTPPCKQIEWLHDRMPFILSSQEDIDKWLGLSVVDDDGKNVKYESVKEMINPFSGKLKFTEISRDINSVKNDSPSCLKPVDEQPKLMSFFGASAGSRQSSPKNKNTAERRAFKGKAEGSIVDGALEVKRTSIGNVTHPSQLAESETKVKKETKGSQNNLISPSAAKRKLERPRGQTSIASFLTISPKKENQTEKESLSSQPSKRNKV
eukprot:Nk52_evm93s221 gene=Nk52_evmTU93s221